MKRFTIFDTQIEILTSTIYHIADSNYWEQAQVSGIYTNPSLNSEGFIHCSTDAQLEETANLYFGETNQILVLFIDVSKLQSDVEYESTPRGTFPHIYGPINLEAVVRTKVFKRRGKKFKITFSD